MAGCFVAAGLVFGMLLDGWPDHGNARLQRLVLLLATLALTAALVVLLEGAARILQFAQVRPDDWVQHASLDGLSASIILHVAIGRRWPFLRSAVRKGMSP